MVNETPRDWGVADLRVVLYAHNTSGRYSTHFPFGFYSLVFDTALRVLIVTFAYPLDCRCAGDE